MAAWDWRGRDARGSLVRGVIDAPAADAVADQLLATGVTPLAIEPHAVAADGAPRSLLQALGRAPVRSEDVLVFSRQMHTLHRSGVPILRALAGLQASASRPSLAALIADLRASLDQGRELAAAMARHPAVFDAFYIAVIHVGEMTGRLTEAFGRLADHLESEMDVRARVKQALRYPTMVLVAIAIALVVVNLFVIPTFATVFAGFHAELPPLTRLLLGMSNVMVKGWPLLLAAAVGTAWGVRAWLATPDGRRLWDRLKLRLPIAGPIVQKATLARFARSFAMADRSGVPITQAMAMVARTVDNAWIGERVEAMREGIERGESLSRVAAASGVFTPVVLQMITVGEETGELDTLLVEIADMYERETDYAIKGLSAAIEPILLALIGAVVLVLALGIFMPLWNLGQAAKGR